MELSSVEPSTNSPGVQHERFFRRRVPPGWSARLAGLRGVDVGVAGVVEDPEHAVEADIDAGRLHQSCRRTGSMPSRPAVISARRSRSESSTRRAYPAYHGSAQVDFSAGRVSPPVVVT